jgi:hypothetical protein
MRRPVFLKNLRKPLDKAFCSWYNVISRRRMSNGLPCPWAPRRALRALLGG